jgi:hypothetical protein
MHAVPEQIRKACLDGYAEYGRGALVFHEADPGRRFRPGMARALYFAQAEVDADPLLDWPDEWTASRVKSYDPQREFVVVFVYDDEDVYCFKGHFGHSDDRKN